MIHAQAGAIALALPWPANASVAHLYVNGTAMVASLAKTSSTIEATTRSLRSLRSLGQMYGHRCTRVDNSVPRSPETPPALPCNPRVIRSSAFRNRYGPNTVEPLPGASYRPSRGLDHLVSAAATEMPAFLDGLRRRSGKCAEPRRRMALRALRPREPQWHNCAMSMIRTICVFCGSGPGADPAFAEAAREFGKILAERRVGLVYGGGSLGLMGTLATSVLDHGGRVTGAIPEFLTGRERMMARAQEIVVTRDMHERKHIMFDRADAFAALPGGIGTLEELV